jgi:hypothetical protein
VRDLLERMAAHDALLRELERRLLLNTEALRLLERARLKRGEVPTVMLLELWTTAQARSYRERAGKVAKELEQRGYAPVQPESVERRMRRWRTAVSACSDERT